MKKSNDNKKQQLKKVGTATALTITLATSNVSTLVYGMELEANTNEEVVVEEVVTEQVEANEVLTEKVATEEVTEETKEEVAAENPIKSAVNPNLRACFISLSPTAAK